MAGRGNTLPKPEAQRRRTNKAPQPATVAPDGQLRGPDLPAGVEWPAETIQWWHDWRTCPQARLFGATDWAFLLDTARLHALFWIGDSALAGEIRLRVSKFGATPEDRLRLHLTIEPEEDEPAAAPPRARRAATDRRKRALKVIDGGG